jgi:hypothetical protein
MYHYITLCRNMLVFSSYWFIFVLIWLFHIHVVPVYSKKTPAYDLISYFYVILYTITEKYKP